MYGILIRKGAEVTYKGHNGDTHIHFCVESSDREIAKLLVHVGEKNSQSDVKLTPAIQASCFGHENE